MTLRPRPASRYQTAETWGDVAFRLLSWPVRLVGWAVLLAGVVGCWGAIIVGNVYGWWRVLDGDSDGGLGIVFVAAPGIAGCLWLLTYAGQGLVLLADGWVNRSPTF